jgi:predicted DCC family thiol-disulfide oxidoreductase YuxK
MNSTALTVRSRSIVLHRQRNSLSRMLFSSKATDTNSDRLFPEEINILYDSKCNVCRLEMEWLRRRDREVVNRAVPKIRLTDLESPTFDASDPANGGVDYVKGMKSMTAITADGKVIQGIPVFRLAYEQVGLGWLFRITQWPVMNTVFDFGYDVFAKYRTLLTRGTKLDTLIQVYEEKKALEAKKRSDSCEICEKN